MAWRIWSKMLGDGQMDIAGNSLSLLLIAVTGCASTSTSKSTLIKSTESTEAAHV